MANIELMETGDTYAAKLDAQISKIITEWWNGLSKNEILSYLASQEQVTADKLRAMLSNEQCVINLGVAFSVSESNAGVDFHTDENR